MNRSSRIGPFLMALFVACSCPATTRAAADQREGTTRVVADWKERRSRLPNAIRLELEGTVTVFRGSSPDSNPPFPPEDHTFPTRSMLLIDFQRNRHRVETSADEAWRVAPKRGFRRIDMVRLYDGKSFQRFYPRAAEQRSGKKSDPGRDLELLTGEAGFGRCMCAFFEGGYPFLSMLPGKLTRQPLVVTDQLRDAMRSPGTATLDGHSYTLLRSPRDRYGRWGELYVDSSRQSAIRRRTEFDADGHEMMRLDITGYRLVDGLWLPAEWSLSESKSGRPLRKEQEKVTGLDLAPRLSDDLFHIEPSAGMVVHDEVTGKTFTVQGRPEEEIGKP